MAGVEMVVALERQRLRALVERDMVAAEALHHQDYELISPDGRRHTKDSYLGDIASKRLEYLAFDPASPITVRATADLIVLRYLARIRLCVGVADELEFQVWHTDHYERHGEQWQVVWSQATSMPD